MYSHCISCSRALGANDHIESFPVGRRVAFDPERGRLWVICGRCSRWNLTPIEERWEPVEEAERLFRNSRQRVQRENIGLARLPDGTRLVRIGDAPDGELAAWRYGRQLKGRRRQAIAGGAAALVAGGIVIAGSSVIAAAAPLSMFSLLLNGGGLIHQATYARRVIARVDDAASPTGEPIALRRRDLFQSYLEPDPEGVALRIEGSVFGPDHPLRDGLTLRGDVARRALARALVDYNNNGGNTAEVSRAINAISDAGGTEAFITRAVERRPVLSRTSLRVQEPGKRYTVRQILGTFRNEKIPARRMRPAFGEGRPRMDRVTAMAVEIALNQESERAALEGELIALERAWREAEEIAAIVDGVLTR